MLTGGLSRHARWVLGAFVCTLAACNGSASAPQAPGSTSAEPARSTTEKTPEGDAQPRLKQGRVVLEAPPRAPVELTVEVADTNESRRRGLMFRRSLADDEGMIFVFPDERPRSFWMRNTLIPLDMFFIDANFEVVGVVADAEPLTDTPRGVEEPAMYVLEVNAGFAAKHGFGAGTRLRYTPPATAEQEVQ